MNIRVRCAQDSSRPCAPVGRISRTEYRFPYANPADAEETTGPVIFRLSSTMSRSGGKMRPQLLLLTVFPGKNAHKKGGVDLSAFHATQGRRIVFLPTILYDSQATRFAFRSKSRSFSGASFSRSVPSIATAVTGRLRRRSFHRQDHRPL